MIKGGEGIGSVGKDKNFKTIIFIITVNNIFFLEKIQRKLNTSDREICSQ